MSQTVTLGYWNIRGFAERVRLLLEYLNIQYDQVIFTPQTRPEWFQKVKPQMLKKNPAANLPYLQDGDKLICQTDAILVYLCHKANRLDLLGQTVQDQVQIATVKGVFTDLTKAWGGYMYGPKTVEQFKEQSIKNMNVHFKKFDGLLGDKQWFGQKMTYVDIVIGDFCQVYSIFDQNFPKEFPKLKDHQQRVWNLQGINNYLKSDKFKERPINYYPEAKWF